MDSENTAQNTQPAGINIPVAAEKTATIKERFVIDFDTPLPHLDINGAKAYLAEDKTDKDRNLYALICSHETEVRNSILPYLKSLNAPHLLKLVEYAVTETPESQQKVMALIYSRPLGGRVIDNNPFKNNIEAVRDLLKNLISSLSELYSCGISHRSIRLENLYYLDAENSKVVLGDCAAAFPAFYQPAAYETIESLIADKEARGSGSEKNDVYALGVLGLSLFRGEDIFAEVADSDILTAKIKKGSYPFIFGNCKIPVMFANIFRGMLSDIPSLRWGAGKLANALEMKQIKHSASQLSEPTKKSITIGGEKVYHPYDLAYALMKNPEEGYSLYTSGKISDWIKNGLEDEEMASEIDKHVKTTTDTTANHEIIMAKICILLAPHFPIKIGSISVFPNALSKALYYAVQHHRDVNDFYKICANDLAKLWYMTQSSIRVPATVSEIKACVNNTCLGFGLDRIIYEYDDDLPCISPLLGNNYVNTPTKILKALNDNYSSDKDKPYDNAIIAYLHAKLGKRIDGIMVDLNSKIPALEASAVLRLYANLQNKYGPQQLPKLAQWLSHYSLIIIKSYHNLKYQAFLEKELLKTHKSGKLHEIVALLENEEARKKDNQEYNIAKKTAAKLTAEKNALMNSGAKLEAEAQELALRSACVLAALVMIVSFVINLIGAIK